MSNETAPERLRDAKVIIRNAAFNLLLASAEAVTVDQLVKITGMRRADVHGHLAAMAQVGSIRLDEAGRVVGSAGLSVTADRHEIQLSGRRFWTWCAYDILGIFGALKASGRALSPSPDGGTIEVRFESGRPVGSDAVLFRPADELMDCCENVYEEWCPNSNLFSDEAQARRWADERGISGQVLHLNEASRLSSDEWAEVI